MSEAVASPPAGALSSDPEREALYRDFLALSERAGVTVLDVVRLGHTVLARSGVVCDNSMGTPLADARHIACMGLAVPPREDALLSAKVTTREAAGVLRLFETRIVRRITAQYVTGEALYYGRYFRVNEHTLTPRSVTGEFFPKLLKQVRWENERILDLCTGSGCMGITLALSRPSASVDLVDISDKALEVAQSNIERFRLQGRVRCVRSNLFENVQGPYSLIVSNPPYVSTSDYLSQPPEYRNEPRLALDAGPDGLDLILPILERAPRVLTPKGTLMVETGLPAAKLLAARYPRIPFKWWKSEFGEPKGEAWVFSLRNGQWKTPLPAPKP